MKPPALSPQWAQVQILLSRGLVEEALVVATAASPTVPKRARMNMGEGDVIGHPALPVGVAFADPRYGWMILNFTVWLDHGHGTSMWEFHEQVLTMDEPAFVPYDVGSWRIADDLSMTEAGLDPSFWYPNRDVF